MINGQKIYTSLAGYADYIWLAARTDPDAPKHRGITIFLVPTTDPGFSYSKISTMVNASTYNTFYDDVRVGDDAVVYVVNRGWDLIVNQLNYERVSLGPPGMVERIYEEVLAWAQGTKLADGRRVVDQEWVQLNFARVHAKLEFAKLINWKVASQGGANPADADLHTEAIRLTALQAIWRLDRGLPAHDELMVAKFWAAEGAQRVVHAAQHLHGGIGVDLDYPIHRYFRWAKVLELTLGGASPSLLRLGASLAGQPVGLG